MPDKAGNLTESERQTVGNHIKSVFKNAACPFCGSTKWNLEGTVVTGVKIGAGGNMDLGGQSVPQVMLSSECGFIAYFSAMKAGITF
jgi:hypothetical protein